MRYAILAIAIECALILPTVLLATRSPAPDLATTITRPAPGEALSVVTGEVRNLGTNTATNVQVKVLLFDSRYGYLLTRSTWTNPLNIPPGATGSFGVGLLSPPRETARYELRVFSGWR